MPEARAPQSQSGQFVVSRAHLGMPARGAAPWAANPELLELEPRLLVVSCDRIRQALFRELGFTPPWRGRIHVRLHPAAGAEAPITVALEKFPDRWAYRVELPEVVERTRLMRALIEVMLLETANQHTTGRSAELPPWLAVGLAEHLRASSEAALLFPPPRVQAGGMAFSTLVTTNREANRLTAARARLRQHPALTVQELNWPTEHDFAMATGDAYRASAQLFVTELLRLPESASCFRALLHELPRHLNWQTAFLKAFRPHFERQLDVDKWWSLQTASFAGRDLAHTWSVAESWPRLTGAVRLPAQIRTAADQFPPASGSISLQEVIRKWDFARQTATLRSQLQQLESARRHMAPELLSVLEDYQRVLSRYLQERERIGLSLRWGRLGRPALQELVADTVKQLDVLDARLNAFQPGAPPPVVPATSPR